jgi:hypothetical protein
MNRQFNLKKRKASRLDYSHHKSVKLGETPLQNELLYLSEILDQGTAPHCTAYQAVAVRSSMKNKSYDPEQQWIEETTLGATAEGTDIQTALATGVKVGFVPNGTTTSVDQASCYLWVNINNGMDLFDSCRRAIQDAGCPLSAGICWMQEWDSNSVVDKLGTIVAGGHAVKIAGWKQINNVPYMVIQNSWGTQMGDNGLWYFSRDVFNKVFGEYGIGYWSDDPNLQIKKLGFFSALLVNLINLYKQLFNQTGVFPPLTMIERWANAIKVQEGWYIGSRSYKNNNPGNLKYSSLTASWGATGKDADNFCIYPDYETGMKALCNFLQLGAEDELIAFHHARTLLLFTRVYAQPPNDNYALNVAKALGVDVNVDISTFI